MHWLVFALLSSVFFALSSLTDKLFIDRMLEKVSAFSIVVLSAIAGLPFLFLMYVFSEQLPDAQTLVYGFTAGWLVLAGTYFYYSSLRRADPAMIMATFQLVLPFNYVFGLIFLDEILTPVQLLGAVIVVIGSIVVSYEENEDGWRIKKQALLMMATASLLVSLSDVVFKTGSRETEFFPLAIAEYTGTALAGIIVFILSKKVHRELKHLYKSHKKHVIAITQFNEALYVTATFLFRYALILGPIALVQVAIGTSPIFVMLFGWIIGFVVPKFAQEKRKRKHFWLQLSAMLFSCLGIVFLSL